MLKVIMRLIWLNFKKIKTIFYDVVDDDDYGHDNHDDDFMGKIFFSNN